MDLYKSTAIPAYQVRFHGAAKFHTLSQKVLAGKQCDVEEQLTGGCGGRDQNILLTFCFKTG